MPNKLDVLFSERLSRYPEICFGMSYRKGGVSTEPFGMNLSFNVGDNEESVRQNREIFFGGLGISLNRVASPKQCHSARVKYSTLPGRYEECDGLMTDKKSVFLAVCVADCVPIFIYDTNKKAVAAVHAGWRGTAEEITVETIEAMKVTFGSNPSDLVTFIGPSAGVCCYKVNEDVSGKFDRQFLRKVNGNTFLDLKAANKFQALNSGVAEESIDVSSYCTICNPKLFHSYRRDKERSGRMMGVIGLT